MILGTYSKSVALENPQSVVLHVSTHAVYFYNFLESRQQGRFAGFSLYISNTGGMESSSLCYKDGPTLPPLNFTTTCTLSGRFVIFYNERLDGVTYPVGYEVEANVYMELCEVSVKGKLRISIKIKFWVVR